MFKRGLTEEENAISMSTGESETHVTDILSSSTVDETRVSIDLSHVSGMDTHKTRVQVVTLSHDVSLVVRRLGTATRVAAEALTALGVCVRDCQDALDEQTDKRS